MRHGKFGKKLGRSSSHRQAMLRNMVTSLIRTEKITTTDAKAKVLKSLADRMVTLGKRGDLHARRQALSFIRDRAMVIKLFDELSPRFRERPGGYTRIVKMGYRHGDNAPVSVIEFIPAVTVDKPKKKTAAKK
ncbi:MAG: 50S ribosomal protein L17 [Syntrophales bacterium]|jgi:large subunit ribosomal protein L17|nr:50S ribosomal protein L17 [Syntrophales bacterium]MDD4338667.1 50S ribosomal protein L17 [Syntrophales bacterium]HOG08421.1 50S ribosomal protein L17 [Syntrophales bacterium]HOS76729.1 50S ribosomal protein L17 [Syntrophales bacterium]HPB69686.1 50S ribosomal protein L17 [Syntrophales bacterium]